MADSPRQNKHAASTSPGQQAQLSMQAPSDQALTIYEVRFSYGGGSPSSSSPATLAIAGIDGDDETHAITSPGAGFLANKAGWTIAPGQTATFTLSAVTDATARVSATPV